MRETPIRIGSHDIVVELAAGGMATTYLAHKRGDAFFARLVVIKRIHPWLLVDPKSGDMLREEARLGAAIQHPHVVHVEDVTNHDREVCLVMPYVESLSLGALLGAVRRAGERIPPAMTSRIMLDVLSGLHAAHDAKDLRGDPLEIVHRDVSPNNVLVGTDGRGRIIDFGIARAASRLCKTRSGDMRGTIAYMSPEQLRRRELDRRADVFAAGAVLYEALTGERLFEGRDEADILIGVLADEIPTVSRAIPDVGLEVDEVLARALCREREERFPTARAFAEALERALPPAPATDVAAFVERFGQSEFSRRRNAIRAFVDGQTIDVPALDDGHGSAASVEARSGKKRDTYRKWSAVLLVSISTAASGGMFFLPRNPSPNAYAQKMAVHLPTTNPAASSDPAEAPPGGSKSDSKPLAPLGSVVTATAPSSPRTPSTPVRRAAPIREKVDKRHSTELQENPYR
ncbi:MAG: serine/threonine protein kinase [Polyangiaceae bacterium]|nr:serine/threonine protein kinase [Polyangiaceae bacterium]